MGNEPYYARGVYGDDSMTSPGGDSAFDGGLYDDQSGGLAHESAALNNAMASLRDAGGHDDAARGCSHHGSYSGYTDRLSNEDEYNDDYGGSGYGGYGGSYGGGGSRTREATGYGENRSVY